MLYRRGQANTVRSGLNDRAARRTRRDLLRFGASAVLGLGLGSTHSWSGASAKGKPRFNRFPFTSATLRDNPGDTLSSDVGGSYGTDESSVVMTSPSGDGWDILEINGEGARQMFLSVPAVVTKLCTNPILRIADPDGDGIIYNMTVGSSKDVSARFYCTEKIKGKAQGWFLDWGTCLVARHPNKTMWIFDSGPGCTADVYEVVNGENILHSQVYAPFGLEAIE